MAGRTMEQEDDIETTPASDWSKDWSKASIFARTTDASEDNAKETKDDETNPFPEAESDGFAARVSQASIASRDTKNGVPKSETRTQSGEQDFIRCLEDLHSSLVEAYPEYSAGRERIRHGGVLDRLQGTESVEDIMLGRVELLKQAADAVQYLQQEHLQLQTLSEQLGLEVASLQDQLDVLPVQALRASLPTTIASADFVSSQTIVSPPLPVLMSREQTLHLQTLQRWHQEANALDTLSNPTSATVLEGTIPPVMTRSGHTMLQEANFIQAQPTQNATVWAPGDDTLGGVTVASRQAQAGTSSLFPGDTFDYCNSDARVDGDESYRKIHRGDDTSQRKTRPKAERQSRKIVDDNLPEQDY